MNRRVQGKRNAAKSAGALQGGDTSVAGTAIAERKYMRMLQRVVIGLLFVLAAALCFHKIHSVDIGFHLKAGDWILDNLKFPGTDVFAYTLGDKTYVDTYWLYQVTLAIANGIGKELGMVLMNTALILVSVWLLLFRSRAYGSDRSLLFALVLFAGILAMSYFFAIRPHVFSWLYLSLIIIVLQRYYRDRTASLVWLPVIMLLWVNSHTLFVLGWVVIGCYVAGIWWEGRKPDKRLLMFAGAAVLVCFINPYGLQGVLLPFKQFLFLQEGSIFKEAISEYESPFGGLYLSKYIVNGQLTLLHPYFGLHLFVLLALLSLLIGFRKRKLHEWLLMFFFGYIMATGLKNVGYFIVAVLPLVADGLAFGGSRAKNAGLTKLLAHPAVRFVVPGIVALVALVITLRATTNAQYINYRERIQFGYAYNDNVLAVKAGQFLLDNKLDGKLLNHINFGSVLMYMLPQQVYIDARNELIGEALMQEHASISSAAGRAAVLKRYAPDIVAFPHRVARPWLEMFGADPNWRLVYYDDLSAIYLRNGYADHIPAVGPEYQAKAIPTREQGEINAILQQRKSAGFFGEMFTQQYYPDSENDLTVFCIRQDWYQAAIATAVNGLEKSTVDAPELYMNLGLLFDVTKQPDVAIYCYKRYLETNENSVARKQLKNLSGDRSIDLGQ